MTTAVLQQIDPCCVDCGVPKSEVIRRKGIHAQTCQSEGRQNIAWGLAQIKKKKYRYIGPVEQQPS